VEQVQVDKNIFFDVFDSFLDAVLAVDEKGIIRYCNPAAALLLQSSIIRLIDKTSFAQIIQFDPELKMNSNFLAIEGDTSQPYREYDFRLPRGESGSVNLTTKKIFLNNTSLHLVIMRDVSLEKTLHQKYQNEIKEKLEIIDKEVEQRIQLQMLNVELDRKIFHMSCLLNYNQKTRTISDSNHILNEFIGYLTERFQFSGGFSLIFDPILKRLELQFINGLAGRKHIYEHIQEIQQTLKKIDADKIPAEIVYITELHKDWSELLQYTTTQPQNAMLSMRIKIEEGRTLPLVFSLPVGHKKIEKHEIELIRNLVQQTEILIENTELKSQSLTDELTKLYNRRYLKISLSHELQKSVQEKKSMSLLMIDIDHFKKLNDIHGHDFGDLALKTVASSLKGMCRITDIPFRYGGEEFILLLPNTDSKNASLVAEKVRNSIEIIPIISDGAQLNITVSIGVATCPEMGSDGESLIKCADIALYAAKKAGRNNVQLFPLELLSK